MKKQPIWGAAWVAPPKVVTPIIPHTIKNLVVKKYRSKDKTKRFVVLRLPKDAGFVVQSIPQNLQPITIAQMVVPTADTTLPHSVWLRIYERLAVWYASQIRKDLTPSQKQIQSRRRRFIRQVMKTVREEQVAAARKISGRFKAKPKPPPILSMNIPYVCLYDPRQSCGDPGVVRTTFRIHTAYCTKLDSERRKAIGKRGGDSWIIEAHTPLQARDLQLKEFNDGDMGYDSSDFTIHECAARPKLVTSKTVLGRTVGFNALTRFPRRRGDR